MVGVDAPSSSTSISVGVDTEVGVLGRVEPRGSEGVLGGVDFLILLCGRKNECADIFGFELGAIVRYLLLRNSARIFAGGCGILRWAIGGTVAKLLVISIWV
jgi:hypothetical protein